MTKQTNILGALARHENALSRVKKGDKCLVYVKGEVVVGERIDPKIVAQYKIASTVFEDNSKIFQAAAGMSQEVFKLRIRLKPIKVYEEPLEFKPLAPTLPL